MNRPAQGAQTERRPEASVNRASVFARPAPVPEGGAGAPLTRRQLRELAEAQQAAEQEAQEARSGKPIEPAKPVEPAKPAEPVRPLSRRELRERAAAAAAERAAADQVTESVAPSKKTGARPVPAVQPPAATGAIRALDETGQLTPVRRVTVATGQIPAPANNIPGLEPIQNQQQSQQRQSTGLNRVGVRESLAQVEAKEAPRVYPQPGATPIPAVPSAQHTPLASGSIAANTWAPVGGSMAKSAPSQTSPAALGEVGQDGASHGLPAPVTVAAVPTDSWSAGAWQPVGAMQQQEDATARSAPAQQPARSAPSAQPVSAQPVSSPPEADDDVPAVPQWGSVLGGAAAHNGLQSFAHAPVASQREEPADTEEDEPGGLLRYTPLQFLVLIVLGLVLGGLVWQLLNVTSGSQAEEPQSATSQVQVIEFEQSYV